LSYVYVEAFSVSPKSTNVGAWEVITCIPPLLSFGNAENL